MTIQDRLRSAALAQLAQSPRGLAEYSAAEVQTVIHELQVHQIELEMQNDELRRTQTELDAERERYFDLYDMAPVSYITVDEEGLILEANLTAARLLGVTRSGLVKAPLSRFVYIEDQDTYHLGRRRVGDSDQLQSCELRMTGKDAKVFWVHMEGNVTRDASGALLSRFVLSDITERKQAEEITRLHTLLLSNMAEGVLMVHLADEAIVYTNPRLEEMFGYGPGDLLGSRSTILLARGRFGGSSAETAAPITRAVEENGEWRGNIDAVRKDGTGFRAYVHASGFDHAVHGKVAVSVLVDLTPLTHAQEELRESNELLALFMRCSPIYSYIKEVTPTESRVLQASDNFHDLTGVRGSEMTGMSMTELFPAEFAARMMADDLAVVTSGKMVQLDEDFGGRNFVTIKFPIKLGSKTLLAGYTIDITERKQAELVLRDWGASLELRVAERTLELREGAARFRQLAEATFEGIAFSENGILLDGNQRLGEIHGCNVAQMIGRPISDFVAPESRDLVADNIRRNPGRVYECTGLRVDGSVFPAEIHPRNGTWMGRTTRITALRDLTQARQAADRLREQKDELAHVQNFALISEISAGIIHQLGQPLSAIGANLSAMVTLKGGELAQCDVLPIIRDVEADVARMRDIVVHLRALANPMQPTRVSTDFNAIVTGVLPLLQQKAANQRALLMVDLSEDLPITHTDTVQMSQVILNLVRNALDASKDCPPELSKVIITTRQLADHSIELCVRDAGCGIDPGTMLRLFTPFFSTKTDGLGVGLRLSQTIVHAHGGTIQGFNNPDGIGATFRIVLPANPSA